MKTLPVKQALQMLGHPLLRCYESMFAVIASFNGSYIDSLHCLINKTTQIIWQTARSLSLVSVRFF